MQTANSKTTQQNAHPARFAMAATCFPELDAFKTVARHVAAILCPVAQLQTVILQLANGLQIPLAVAPVYESPPVPEPTPQLVEDFHPTAAQWKMIQAISTATKSTKKQLVNVAGDRVYLRSRGGLDELCRQDIVQAVAGSTGSFELTDLGYAMLAEREENEEV